MTSPICSYLQVVTRAALRSKSLYLERVFKVYGQSEPWSDHELPNAIEVALVILWILRRTQNSSVRMDETSTTWLTSQEKQLILKTFICIIALYDFYYLWWFMDFLFTFGKGSIEASSINAAIGGKLEEHGVASRVERTRQLPPAKGCD